MKICRALLGNSQRRDARLCASANRWLLTVILIEPLRRRSAP
jgi:hypothetical protein